LTTYRHLPSFVEVNNTYSQCLLWF